MIPVCCRMPFPSLSNGFRGSGNSATVIGFPALTPNELSHRARWALALILPFVALLEWAWTAACASSPPDVPSPPAESSLP